MTREEAIDIIKCLAWHTRPDEEDVEQAIKVLKQESCEDCISRAQALSDYADWYGYGYRDNTFYKRLKDLPPVTPKPKADVLDKIRAEIQDLRNCSCNCSDGIIDDAIDIIDKYMTEREEEQYDR